MDNLNTGAIVKCLLWQDISLSGRAKEDRMTRIAYAIRNEELYSSEGARDRILKCAMDLPPERLSRLLAAPEVFRRLVMAARGEPGFEGWIANCLAAEVARSGGATEESIWTATADFGINSEGCVFAAPLLGTIPVDYYSPRVSQPLLAGKHRSVQFGRTEGYSHSAALAVMEKLQQAMELLRTISPHIWAMVQQATQVIQLRHDANKPDFYTSASCNAEIGRTVLFNPHLAAFDVPSLANALLHESIHSVLYSLEQGAPLLPSVDPRASSHLLIESPWTGGVLHLHTYVHACFVWFGLTNLWQSVNRPLSVAEAKHLRRAKGGFESNEPIRRLKGFEHLLGEGVLAAMNEVTGLVLSARPPEEQLIAWRNAPISYSQHVVGYQGVIRESNRPVFGKIARRRESDKAIASESRVLAKLDGIRGVPKILKRPAGDGPPFLVLEGLNTRPLCPTIDVFLNSCSVLAQTLGEIHRRQIVHSNIRSEHIMWRPGDTGPVLIDFSSALDTERRVEAGGTVGNWLTSPPDQLLPDRPCPGPHWDTYALCSMAFTVMTGQAPASQTSAPKCLNETGRALWRIAHATMSATPATNNEDLRRLFDELRAGLHYNSLLRCTSSIELPEQDVEVLRNSVLQKGGTEDQAASVVACLTKGLQPVVVHRYVDGHDLSRGLAACIVSC